MYWYPRECVEARGCAVENLVLWYVDAAGIRVESRDDGVEVLSRKLPGCQSRDKSKRKRDKQSKHDSGLEVVSQRVVRMCAWF
jgi:hypothetical protein